MSKFNPNFKKTLPPGVLIARMQSPVQCNMCHKVYDLALINVKHRYREGDVYQTPCCNRLASTKEDSTSPSFTRFRPGQPIHSSTVTHRRFVQDEEEYTALDDGDYYALDALADAVQVVEDSADTGGYVDQGWGNTDPDSPPNIDSGSTDCSSSDSGGSGE